MWSNPMPANIPITPHQPTGPYLVTVVITAPSSIKTPLKIGYVGLTGEIRGKAYSPSKQTWVDLSDTTAPGTTIDCSQVPGAPGSVWVATFLVPALFSGQPGVNIFDGSGLWMAFVPDGVAIDVPGIAHSWNDDSTPATRPEPAPIVQYYLSKPLWL